MKTLTVRQVAQLKRTAQNVYPLVNSKNKIQAKIASLNEELDNLNAQINAWEGATIAMTGGYTSEDLIARTVICATDEYGTVKTDKNGMPVKITRYEPKGSILSYNPDKNIYEIIELENSQWVNEETTDDAVESTENNEVITPNAFPKAGNDFDEDSDNIVL